MTKKYFISEEKNNKLLEFTNKYKNNEITLDDLSNEFNKLSHENDLEIVKIIIDELDNR